MPKKPTFPPTEEQTRALDYFETDRDLVIEAGAGTGKTSTLQLLAHNTGGRDGLYLAYNKAIQVEAASRFPSWVPARTAHSLAYRAVVNDTVKDRLQGERLPWYRVADVLGINGVYSQGTKRLATGSLARLTAEMVDRFCQSAATEISVRHRPYVEGIDDLDDLGEKLLPYARAYWEDLQRPNGRMRFTHDHYLKLWQLTDPVLDAEFVLFDEAQDANPCIAHIVAAQKCQRVYVGDRAQAIYGWRGAVDAMDIPGVDKAYLSKSFRFGPAIAEYANTWLEQLDTPLRLEGFEEISSSIGPLAQPRAVLCRTNGEAFSRLIQAQELGVKAHLMGGGNEMKAFCRGADELKSRGSSGHRDLMAFDSWVQVQEYIEEPGAGELKTLVELVDRYGTARIISALDRMWDDEASADLTISTAHKAKGREWDTVTIARDFEQRRDQEGQLIPLEKAEIMLRYVAVTRAKQQLDPGPLALRPQLVDVADEGQTLAR